MEKITSDADREALKRIEAAEKRAGAVRSQNVKEIEEAFGKDTGRSPAPCRPGNTADVP